ncbi:Fe-hydrogenase, putative [Entamoeba histolytica HM-1:IMSS-B]|uniref:Fe-hydrogenase, putative n=6 Tax=Entamoeba histolytica TaxID=5759 RepID=A0A8U0WQ60_ENTH1|nr:Fe-hydrogenase, putative [Entamoeba histolytica HM-1:IMSS]AAO17820.1 putative long iron-dependent hydrogenase 2 [Entamoeba histolytica]EMD46993.1 long irondependent hydrogenase, putative [Entamoeba histolytica KU27]EMH72037.1 Fe-hydrogenase, putative [Entamoeba histolytica HM-1:IMSS-B]EMS13470.1 long iron-dependent hydrogenase 2, putative [Entamoeba histolytica HM-3:IMSS]ENY62423.1 long iron-dependent hydrogenase 2, putative [Entamoeba histolytica HM-1:IMSS-A]|eukprot:XP_652839.1 Fe-hydrogenase, putative [Entamoeba histolytica HM-1:IMSS]
MSTQLTPLRNKIISEVVKCFKSGRFIEDIDKLPTILTDGDGWKPTSKFVHSREQEEGIYREKVLSVLGFVDGEYDDITPLHVYAQKALERTSLHEPVFGISQKGCNKCHFNGYFVTQACEGCTSRPCSVNCPKKCISFGEDGRAVINQNNCIKCGRCYKFCPYGAIISKSVPCVKACPCGAMLDSPEGVKTIDFEKCINCGGCMRACPFGAILPRSNLIDVLKILPTKKVVACPAPSIAAHFGKYDLALVSGGLIQVGFTSVEDVSYGADLCALNEAKEFEERIVKNKKDFMTTSCCPAYINAINKHMPELKENVSHTPTPMHFATQAVKDRDQETVTVFIGPCNAKRWETLQDSTTDYCLTFDEIFGLFEGSGIDLSKVQPYTFVDKAHKEGKIFAVSGGVASAVASLLPKEVPDGVIKPTIIDGFSQENFKRLKNFKKNITGNLVEVMVCEGGCAYGPGCPGLNTPATSAKIKIAVDKMEAHPEGRWVGLPNSQIKPIKVEN